MILLPAAGDAAVSAGPTVGQAKPSPVPLAVPSVLVVPVVEAASPSAPDADVGARKPATEDAVAECLPLAAEEVTADAHAANPSVAAAEEATQPSGTLATDGGHVVAEDQGVLTDGMR